MASVHNLRANIDNKPVTQFCRVCACEITESPCEIENNPARPELPLLLKRYMPEFDIKVASPCLCMECVRLIYTFHNFKKKFLRMEEDLRLYIRKHPEVKTVHLNEVFTSEEADDSVTNAKKFPCELCSRTFPYRQALNVHIKDFHGRELLQCDQCSRQFIKKSLYDVHLEYHKRIDSDRFVCKICNIVFHRACSLGKHVASIHKSKDETLFKCEVCGRKFAEKSLLETHRQTHVKEKFKYRCTLCKFGTNAVTRLNKHLNTCHSREVDLKLRCKICKRVYRSETYLRRHVRQRHHKQRPYQCTKCSRTFVLKKVYDRHVAFHKKTHANRYMCEICNFAFASRTSVAKHRRSKHSE